MKNLFNIKLITVSLVLGLMFTSCSDDDDPIIPQEGTTDYSNNLENIILNVVVENYKVLKEKGEAMASTATAVSLGDQTALENARVAWKEMRIYWENSESTLYGPAGDEGLGVDGNIDSWPIDLQYVTDVLEGSTEITVDFIASQDANAKGFHALEYLLWGIDGQKSASDLTDREIDYIKATASYLSRQTTSLYTAWSPSGNNFAVNFTDAENGIYISQISALLQIIDGMSVIADEVGNGKMYDPMYANNGNYSLEDEESRFSNNSKADFTDNIRGIKYVYLGDYSGNKGLGISDIVAANNAELDTEIKEEIDEAIHAIETIPGTFTDAIQNNRPAVEEAIEEVVELFEILNSKLRPYISSLD
ncbi:MAG: imelysin family protein [Moheibacter sp.]